MTTLKGTFSITRMSSNDEKFDNKIKFSFVDENSHIQFLTVYLDAEDLGMALTGLSDRDIEYQIRKSENLGKKRESRRLTITISEKEMVDNNMCRYARDMLRDYLNKNKEKYATLGWQIDTYLNSQGSIGVGEDDSTILNVTEYRYV